MHQYSFRFGIVALAGIVVTSAAQAAVVDSVAFANVQPVAMGTFNYTSGTLRQYTAPSSYTIGRIDYTGNTTEINGTTSDYVSETAFRAIYPGGAPTTDKSSISPIAGYSGTVTFSGNFLLNPGAVVPMGGVYNFYFINTYDDTPTGQPDNNLNITFNITDEAGGGAPPNTNVGTLPLSAVTTAALNITQGGVVWYKFTVSAAGATSATQYLDIDTNGSANDLDFGLFDSVGNPLVDRDGIGSPWEPFLTYGAPAYPRVPIGNTLADGSDGNLAAGTYYLAVAEYNITLGTGWTATTNGTFIVYSGLVAFRTGTIAPPAPPPTPLYEQTIFNSADPNGNGFSCFLGSFNAGATTYDRELADEFTVPNPGWNLTGASGSFINGGSITPTGVRVDIYQKTGGGAPGALVVSYVRPWSAVTLYSEGNYSGDPVFRYLVDFGATTNLSAGDYMVMVQPQGESNHLWMTSTPTSPQNGNSFFYRRGPAASGTDATWPTNWTAPAGGGIFTVSHDLAFAVYGTVAAPSNVVTGTVNFGNLAPIYNGGPLPSSIPVSFRNAANVEIATGSASYNPVTGAFSAAVPGAVVVPYRVSFKLGFWLRKTLPNPAGPAAPFGSYAFGTVAPLVGDADDDNDITNADYALWAGTNGNSVAANTGADFDGDGEITNSDYALWAANNGTSGDN